MMQAFFSGSPCRLTALAARARLMARHRWGAGRRGRRMVWEASAECATAERWRTRFGGPGQCGHRPPRVGS